MEKNVFILKQFIIPLTDLLNQLIESNKLNTEKESIYPNSVLTEKGNLTNCLLLCTMKWKVRGNIPPVGDVFQWYKKGSVEISYTHI